MGDEDCSIESARDVAGDRFELRGRLQHVGCDAVNVYWTWISVGLNQSLVLIDYSAVHDSDTGELHNTVIPGETRSLNIHNSQSRTLLAVLIHSISLPSPTPSGDPP